MKKNNKQQKFNFKRYQQPNSDGFFGAYGGRFVPPGLDQVLKELEQAYLQASQDPSFLAELKKLYREFVGRPSKLYFAQKLTQKAGGAKIYLKREDLNHTGAHKINNTVGQALLAKRLGKTKLIAETGAGQHGVAVATVAALFGMSCDVYMGARDIDNQKVNVFRMKLLGARVVPVTAGQATLKDAVDAALQAYAQDGAAYYMLGSAVGPHPYPVMVRDFQKVVGEEIRAQLLANEKRLPDYVVACVGGGSNAIGAFYDFIREEKVNLVAVEPAGKGIKSGKHGLSLLKGKKGTIHGFICSVLQNQSGEIAESYSAASGLDYPGVGPELSHLVAVGRLKVVGITDKQAVQAFETLAREEGIIPALESAHAIAYGLKLASKLSKNQLVVINLSGRGDKDVENVYKNLLHS